MSRELTSTDKFQSHLFSLNPCCDVSETTQSDSPAHSDETLEHSFQTLSTGEIEVHDLLFSNAKDDECTNSKNLIAHLARQAQEELLTSQEDTQESLESKGETFGLKLRNAELERENAHLRAEILRLKAQFSDSMLETEPSTTEDGSPTNSEFDSRMKGFLSPTFSLIVSSLLYVFFWALLCKSKGWSFLQSQVVSYILGKACKVIFKSVIEATSSFVKYGKDKELRFKRLARLVTYVGLPLTISCFVGAQSGTVFKKCSKKFFVIIMEIVEEVLLKICSKTKVHLL